MANLDTFIRRGDTDVKDKLKSATSDIQKMGADFEETKEGLSGMPGGLDSDIAAMIEAARDQGRAEAEADIEGVKASAVADARANADSIKGDVTEKIRENNAAKSKMGAIRSKYGKSAIDQASAALDQNTDKGNELMNVLDQAMEEADREIAGVKDRL